MTESIERKPAFASAPTDAEVLEYISSHPEDCLQHRHADGTINMDGVKEDMRKSRKRKVLDNYIDRIGKLNGKTDKRFYIRLKDPTKSDGRCTVKAQTKEELLDKIYDWHVAHVESELEEPEAIPKEEVTLANLFPEFLAHKQATTWSAATVKKNLSTWKHYYADNPIIDVPIVTLKVKHLREWAYGLILENDLTRKEFLNVSTWMKQMLEYAAEDEIIDRNPYLMLKITNDNVYRQIEQKPDENKVLTPEQEMDLYRLCWHYFETKHFPVHHLLPLAIIMLFQLGVRPCEICTLRYEDIEGDEIVIKRYFSEKGARILEGRTKAGHGPRRVILTSLAKEIIQTAKAHQQAEGFDDAGFIFMVSGNFKSFYDRMRKAVPAMCLKIGAPRNTPYAGRRTFISSLLDANVNIKTIRNYVGHKDARTTLNNYCFDRKGKKARAAQLEAARLPLTTSESLLEDLKHSQPDQPQSVPTVPKIAG